MSAQTSNTNSQLRVMLLRGEVQRVKPNYRGLRVRSGRAWVTVNGRDLVLKPGEEIALEMPHAAAVMSPLGHAPLVVELLGEAPCHPTIDPRLVASTL
jgi:ferric-dicitrate binding protein FerR (iron transport regulator)